jgi:hypothetical protein
MMLLPIETNVQKYERAAFGMQRKLVRGRHRTRAYKHEHPEQDIQQTHLARSVINEHPALEIHDKGFPSKR